MNSTMGKRLKALRGALTQAEIAKQLGIPQTTWSNWEKGRNKPDLGLIDKLCTEFGVSIEWILFGRGEIGKNDAGEAQKQNGESVHHNKESSPQCLALYARLDQVNERLYESMRENAALKEENLKLRQELKSFKNGQSNNGNASPMASAS